MQRILHMGAEIQQKRVNRVVPLRGTPRCLSESVGCAALHPRLLTGDRYAVDVVSPEMDVEMRELQIRNPKHEIRNRCEIRN